MKAGWFDLEVKMSLIIFPLIYGSRPIEAEEKFKVYYFYVLACTIASLFLIGNASVTYIQTGINKFYYTNFSVFLHPSYFAMYLNLAIVMLVLQLKNNYFRLNKLIIVSLIGFFSLIIFLLASKMGIFITLLLFIILIINYIRIKRKFLLGFLMIGLLFSTIISAVVFVPSVKHRVEYLYRALTVETAKNENESSAIRLMVWKSSVQVISQNLLFGSGTGDVKSDLVVNYKKNGIDSAYEHQYNAHNAYLQLTIALGLFGLLIFLLSLFLFLKTTLRNKNYIYFAFILIVSINFLVESMLDTQAGVIFYAFFNSFLCFTFVKANKFNSQVK